MTMETKYTLSIKNGGPSPGDCKKNDIPTVFRFAGSMYLWSASCWITCFQGSATWLLNLEVLQSTNIWLCICVALLRMCVVARTQLYVDPAQCVVTWCIRLNSIYTKLYVKLNNWKIHPLSSLFSPPTKHYVEPLKIGLQHVVKTYFQTMIINFKLLFNCICDSILVVSNSIFPFRPLLIQLLHLLQKHLPFLCKIQISSRTSLFGQSSDHCCHKTDLKTEWFMFGIFMRKLIFVYYLKFYNWLCWTA